MNHIQCTDVFLAVNETNFIEMSILRIILAIIAPPLGVFFTVGLGGAFWLNILLTLLGGIPGIIHAIWVIAKHDQ